jgi:hypothetical protein
VKNPFQQKIELETFCIREQQVYLWHCQKILMAVLFHLPLSALAMESTGRFSGVTDVSGDVLQLHLALTIFKSLNAYVQ